MSGSEVGGPGVGGLDIRELDVGALVGEIQRQFPYVRAWYGTWTGSWWAVVPVGRSGCRLVEARNPRQLREAIRDAADWPYPRGGRVMRWDGRR